LLAREALLVLAAPAVVIELTPMPTAIEQADTANSVR